MTMRKWIIVLVIIGLSGWAAWWVYNKSIRMANEKMLKNEILALDDRMETAELNALTPFEWDTLYSFAPYTPRDVIYKTVGYKWASISETVSEGMNQIVFTKEGKVVCYVYGHPENMGYGLFFSRSEDELGVTVLYRKDRNLFSVSRNDSILSLTQLTE